MRRSKRGTIVETNYEYCSRNFKTYSYFARDCRPLQVHVYSRSSPKSILISDDVAPHLPPSHRVLHLPAGGRVDGGDVGDYLMPSLASGYTEIDLAVDVETDGGAAPDSVATAPRVETRPETDDATRRDVT
ncbi:hypothetical protein V9T40_013131 [Parthenolecanium corni]|uniref:Uncharacterized protein n=1 Tax=Parthenolecanium corni TaxID=536013 RepID=A0AAN9Y5E7_9HEMI